MDGMTSKRAFDSPPVYRAELLGTLIDSNKDLVESERRLPPHLLDALHDAGLFRILLPKPYGGEEATPAQFFAAIEAVARHDASVAWCLCQANGCAMTAAYLAPDVANDIWGNDPRAVLAWGPGKAEAVQTDNGFSLSGNLMFASGGRHATWLGAHTPVKTASGETVLNGAGKPELRTFLMPAADIEMEDMWHVIGLRGTASDGYKLENKFVSTAYTTFRDDPTVRTYSAPLYKYPAMTMYATGFAGVALGIAQGFLSDFLQFAQGKVPRMARSTVANSPVAQAETATASARIMASRALLMQESEQVWAETLASGSLSPTGRARIRLASTFAIHEAKGAVNTLYDLAGADAIFASGPFERRFRDIHTVTQQLQGRKTHMQSVGAWLMGHEPDLNVM